jgi:hypothetical protein
MGGVDMGIPLAKLFNSGFEKPNRCQTYDLTKSFSILI